MPKCAPTCGPPFTIRKLVIKNKPAPIKKPRTMPRSFSFSRMTACSSCSSSGSMSSPYRRSRKSEYWSISARDRITVNHSHTAALRTSANPYPSTKPKPNPQSSPMKTPGQETEKPQKNCPSKSKLGVGLPRIFKSRVVIASSPPTTTPKATPSAPRCKGAKARSSGLGTGVLVNSRKPSPSDVTLGCIVNSINSCAASSLAGGRYSREFQRLPRRLMPGNEAQLPVCRLLEDLEISFQVRTLGPSLSAGLIATLSHSFPERRFCAQPLHRGQQLVRGAVQKSTLTLYYNLLKSSQIIRDYQRSMQIRFQDDKPQDFIAGRRYQHRDRMAV